MSKITKTIVLIGLMGSGKSRIGTDVARLVNLPFIDVDREIEKSAGMSIVDIFDRFGEAAFRQGERKVMQRLLTSSPAVLASGGGAFMNAETRRVIKEHGISVWLRASLDTLVERTSRTAHRPLLNDGDKKQTLQQLIEQRYPVYAEADLVVDTDGMAPMMVARKIRDRLLDPTSAEMAVR